jgi:hypothetical protein
MKPAYGNNITYINPDNGIGYNGTPEKPIYYLNYPDEEPILDCKYVFTSGAYISGLVMYDVHWIRWKGLTIRNVYQRRENIEPKGIVGYPVSNMVFENMTVNNIGGCGWYMHSSVGVKGEGFGWDNLGYIPYDTIKYINCDTYQCCDTFKVNPGQTPGNMADGFKYIAYSGANISYEGCRAWHCSDDGFDLPTSASLVKVSNCWSFDHIYQGYNFEGNGFKIAGGSDSPTNFTDKTITNCLANMCNLGIFIMDNGSYQSNYYVNNNTLYRNEIGIQLRENPSTLISKVYFHNNIIFGTTTKDAAGRPYNLSTNSFYSESNNTWKYGEAGSLPNWEFTDNVSVDNSDFLSLNEKDLKKARNKDGSLPDINFLKLSKGSDLIDAGINAGLPFLGNSPDLGAFEME